MSKKKWDKLSAYKSSFARDVMPAYSLELEARAVAPLAMMMSWWVRGISLVVEAMPEVCAK